MRKAPFVRLALAKGSLEDPAENDLQPLLLSHSSTKQHSSPLKAPPFSIARRSCTRNYWLGSSSDINMPRSGPSRAGNRIQDMAKSFWKNTKEKTQKAVKKLPPRKTKKRETRKPLERFRFFMDLPPEIRLTIWDNIERRLDLYHHVHIHAILAFPHQDRSSKSKTVNQDTRFPSSGEQPALLWSGQSAREIPKGAVFLSTTAPPMHPFLHACSESRFFLINKHKLIYAFGAFINPDRDIFYLTSSPMFQMVWPGAIGIALFAQLLRETKLNRKMQKFAIDVVYDFRNRRVFTASAYAGVIKRQLYELKTLFMVQGKILKNGKRWPPTIATNNILFATIPRRYQSRTQRQNHENAWTHVEPSVTHAPLYRHVFAMGF
jgi:hypothetical protein